MWLGIYCWLTFVAVPLLALAQQFDINGNDPFKKTELRPLKLEVPYLDKHFSNRYYDYGGSTFIRNDAFIRITADAPDQRGWMASKVALPEAFQLEMEFQIHGQGNSMYGDGLALWMLKQPPKEAGGVFGLPDYFDGTAIAIDTYKNNGPGRIFPYLLLMKGDGKTRYDQENDGRANEQAGWSVRGIHNAKARSKMRVTYVRGRFISVEIDYRGRGRYEKAFDVPGYDAGNPVYLALSGQTGELSENHDIYSLYVHSLNNPPRSFADVDYYLNGNKNAPIGQYDKSKNSNSESSWSFGGMIIWIVKKLLWCIFLAGLAYGGFTLYRAWVAHKKTSRYDPGLYL